MNILYALEEDLSPDEIIAVQLSHNSLHGSDDKGILKRLFDEIQSVEFKEFAHISSDDIQIEDMFTGSIVPISEHYKVSLILYKNDIKLLGELMEIVKTVNDESDLVFLADAKDSEDEFIDILTALKKEFNIKSTSIAFSKLLEIAKSAMIQK